MMDLLSFLTKLHRPRLLVRAARYGITDYKRDVHLTRILGTSRLPRSAVALTDLINLEMDADELRRQKAATYSPARHVELLIAMMGEAQLLRASTS